MTDLQAKFEIGFSEGKEQGLAIGHERGFTDGREVGLAIGREKGFADGRERGFADGLEKGFAEGEIKKAKEMAKGMLFDDVPIKQIAKYTGFSEEEISKL